MMLASSAAVYPRGRQVEIPSLSLGAAGRRSQSKYATIHPPFVCNDGPSKNETSRFFIWFVVLFTFVL